MSFTDIPNYCRFNAAAGGTSAFTVDSAVADHGTPDDCEAVDGKVYHYIAQSADGSQHENGHGVYTKATHTLARGDIIANSDDTDDPVDFTSAPIVDLYPSTPTILEYGSGSFPAGTRLTFPQAAAPVGWTRITTYNDAALRVVDGNGTVSSGGSNGFSTVMAQTTVGNTTLAITQIPAHDHDAIVGNLSYALNLVNTQGAVGGGPTGLRGGGQAHDHTITMSMKYVDIIICSKD